MNTRLKHETGYTTQTNKDIHVNIVFYYLEKLEKIT